MSTFEKIGFVGLGEMGGPMARCVLDNGYSLVAYDIEPPRLAPLAAAGATLASSPCELAQQVDVILLCLPNAAPVKEVLFGRDGIAAAMRADLFVIDTTTLVRSEALEIAADAVRRGWRYCDSPVSGMPKRATDGTLTVMFGGSAADYAQAEPLLGCFGSTLVHCGEVGNGQLMKALNNVAYDVNIAAMCEVMVVAMAAGLDVDKVAAVLTSGSAKSFASEHFVPRILQRQFGGDFSLTSAYKDIVNLQEVATRLGALTPVVNAMTAVYQQAIAQGFGDEAKHAMVKVYERVLDVEVRNKTDG